MRIVSKDFKTIYFVLYINYRFLFLRVKFFCMGMLHASKIPLVMDVTDEKGLPKKVNLSVYTSKGEIMECQDVILTSYFHRNGTLNLKFPNGEIRKIRLVLIVQFNGMEVYL
jgi:hypothetical protein